MTSRERILLTLKHEEPDRVPIDLGGMRSSGIHAIAYNKLKHYLNCKDKSVKIYDLAQQLAIVDNEIRERVSSDVVELKRLDGGFGTRINSWKQIDLFLDGGEYYVPTDFNPKVLADGSFAIEIEGKIVALMPKGGYYFDSRYAPLANASERKEIDIILSNRITGEELDFLEAQAREIKNNTDCAILGSFGGNFIEMGHTLFGYQEFMERLILNKSFIEYFLSKLEEKYLEEIERYLNRVGKYIDIIVLGDDYGTQEDLQISIEMFRQLFKPHLKALCDFIEERSDVYIFLHSCGAVNKLIPDLIDAGIQILNPVQTSAKGMSPELLKKKFGKDIVFWGGGCDTQRILPFGTLEEVENDVKKRIDVFAPEGGFVFAAIHNIQYEVSPEKCLRLFDTARDYGKYRS
ncbi:MAG: methyltransferase [Candidatus Methanolliviera hydrocarbonicum]|uniref:Methyltransferase n=1 Tax=Candidatus Methanolliviera hydrocarbonicum TaxID=2491085 RepID=A0A520KUG0_9EURY|nr:MAG: methyltransferase [Candidatus Methanolliviera hydrocarbonicum]